MNTDKAYLLGLIVGGGVFGHAEDAFRIRLPFKKWGSYLENPQRAGQIAGDILRKVGQMFRAIYNLSVQYEATESIWTILCEGDTTSVKNDLMQYGIACEGRIWESTDIGKIVPDLTDDNLKRRFIAGLADTIGSMAKSHRRFTDEHQILSIEISGFRFNAVCNLCKLLYSINCIPDQVNWNHPNIHCTKNPYYSQWHKGFKLRILLDQYARFGAFAFRTKAESLQANRKLQQQTHSAVRCEEREINVSPSTVHPAEHDTRLPEIIRGGHYLHFCHICAAMGCEHAPANEVKDKFADLGKLVIPFPILCKDSYAKINEIISNDLLLANRVYNKRLAHVNEFLAIFQNDSTALIYGTNKENGYKIMEVLQAIAYIIADDSELNGNRPRGSYIDIIEQHLKTRPDLQVEVRVPDLLTPLVFYGNNRGALVGATNPSVYGRLIVFDRDNQFKFSVRKITEEDLRNDN